MKDYYAILEVAPVASQEAIREQYLLLIQAWHPDKFPNPAQKAKAEQKCKEINIAYDVLKDTQKRAKYDRELRGQSSRSGRVERRPQTSEQRPRTQHEEARWRPVEEQPQQKEPAEKEALRAEHERQAREEWVRVFFEQARRRQSGQPPVEPRRDSQDPIRVLVVDDVAHTRARIRDLLNGEADIRVVGEASDGVDAVRQFDALMPDVTTIGNNLPTMDGAAATEAIRRKHPIAKVIIISVQGETNYIWRSATAGACDYLISPPAADELLLAVRLAAGRGTFTSENATTK